VSNSGGRAWGRWVQTFAVDIQPGDQIRTDGKTERCVIGRTFTDAIVPTFLLRFAAGEEPIHKTAVVEIWDAGGATSRPLMDLSAQAADERPAVPPGGS
jgi:hypothetical protein